MQPLVSVICLCYNHARFLREALDSVLNQTYKNLEIIVVDDYSTDNSRAIIEEYIARFPQIKYLPNEKNVGNCAAFNRGYRFSKGEFLIDFATDDVLLPNRIEEQVVAFQKLDKTYGILFTDAEFIDDNGNHLRNFYKRDKNGQLAEAVPEGHVFADVIGRHYISSPTMMMRRSVFDKLNGYDETLAYEDFDFWVRSARTFKYFFLDKVLTKRRIHATQLSSGWYKPHDPQLLSTIKVCEMALGLCKSPEEKKALVKRIQYETRQAVFSANHHEAELLHNLYCQLEKPKPAYFLLNKINSLKLNLTFIREFYHWLKHG